MFCLAKLKKVKKKKKRGEGEYPDEERPYITKVFAKFSHDAPMPMVKKKHLTVEQLNARRRKVWLTIAKKEIPKVCVTETFWVFYCCYNILSNHHLKIIFVYSNLSSLLSLLQTFKQKTSAKNVLLTNAKKVRTQISVWFDKSFKN